MAGGGLARQHAQPFAAHGDQIALAHLDHRQAAGRGPFGIHQNSAIHFLILDLDPLAVQVHLRAVIRRAVKALREGAVHVGANDSAVAGGDRHRAMIVDRVEDFLQALRGGGADLDAREAGVALPLTDLDLLDRVRAAARQDLVQDLGQEQRVDDVALQFDELDEIARGGAGS